MNGKGIAKIPVTRKSWKWIACIFCIFFLMGAMASNILMNSKSEQQGGVAERISFSCSPSINGIPPSTMAKTPRGEIAVIRWVSDHFKDSGFGRQTRCDLVSKNFQKYQDDGTLNYITTGIMNEQSVVCVSSKAGGYCTGLLFTLKPDEDASRVIQQLFDISYKAQAPLYESSGSPRIYIDMKKFLAEAPVQNN